MKLKSRPQHPLSGRDVTEGDREGMGEGENFLENGVNLEIRERVKLKRVQVGNYHHPFQLTLVREGVIF